MSIPVTLSLTESQQFTALRAFLLTVVTPGTDVIRSQDNLVPEPAGADFVMMTPIRSTRLATNGTDYFDNIITGHIDDDILTVTAVTQSEGDGLTPGMLLIDDGYPTMRIAADTAIVDQISGSPSGGVGIYHVTVAQTLASETLYGGVRSDISATQWVVQLDIHGPASANNTQAVATLFRSDEATELFDAQGVEVVPLYCGEARQMPFINAEDQYENRWTMDCCMQISPAVGTPEQFFDQAQVTVHEYNPGA